MGCDRFTPARGDLVIVHGGEGGHSLVALRAADGAPAWKSEGCPGYASPIAATLAGVSQILAFNTKTWNPIALSGDLLLVRNDREAVCLRLKLARPVASSL